MKQKEIKFIDLLNKKFNKNLVPSKDTFDVYDAYNKNSIVEIKIRENYYDTKFFQIDKCYQLLMVGEANNKTPYYIVKDPKGIYVYNILSLKERLLRRKILNIKSPYTTEFYNNIMIDKYFYELTEMESNHYEI